MRALLVLLLLLAPSVWADWEALENCSLVENSINDGDSFMVQTPQGKKVFRLYFVDCPETSDAYPDRVKEQAGYFSTSKKRALRLGNEATDLTRKLLKPGSFTVWTRGQMVFQSGRQYGFIQLKDGRWLDRILVRNGLARIYGKRITLPDGKNSREYREELAGLEKLAKKGKLGGWRR